jgi:3-dehydroquinate dehydratase / shikimate dehydrogenase
MNNGKICISICARTASELFEKIGLAEPSADVIELRFDCLDHGELDAALDRLPKISKQYLTTYRPSEQGGKRVLPLSIRIMFWKRALKALSGYDFLADREVDINFPFGFERGRLIRSHHFFGKSPDDLRPAYFELADIDDEIIKIAADCPDITDTIKVWKLIDTAEKNEGRVIPIAMGEAGKWTRILGPAFGAYLTYASLGKGGETAPGQIVAEDLLKVFRVREIDRDTHTYGIIAGNTSYSVSPWLHNAAFKAARMNRVFLPLQVADLDSFVRRMVRLETREIELNFAGFSVTNPHKQAIIPHLDEIDETARRIGAVNTVKIEGDKLYGYNTDAPGFIAPLKSVFGDLKGARVAVVGAGGAARACIFALKQEGAEVTVLARNSIKAKALANEFDAGSEVLVPDHSFDADILINTTPLGTKGDAVDEAIAKADQLEGLRLVYDLVYNPAETRLLHEAKRAGVPVLGGLEMLIAQGARQFEIWTGEKAPVDEMAKAVRTKLDL